MRRNSCESVPGGAGEPRVSYPPTHRMVVIGMTNPKASPTTALQAALLRKVSDGKSVDFQGLAQVVAEHGGPLFTNNPGDVATDYVVWGISSVVHAYHNAPVAGLQIADPAVLQQAQQSAIGQ